MKQRGRKREEVEESEEEFSDHSGSLSSEGSDEEEYLDDDDDMEEGGAPGQQEGGHQKREEALVQARKRTKTSSKFDLPSKEEQMHLRETQNLMTSNLLHLQVDEMLKEVHDDLPTKPTSKRSKLISWLSQFQSDLCKVKVKGGEVSDSWLKKNKITCLHLENYTTETTLNFTSPSQVDIVGSFDLNTATKPYTNIDLVVKIPEECFNHRDILNHVYFDKRKLYLAVILKCLRSSSSSLSFKESVDMSTINISYLKGDTRKPILTLKPLLKTPYVVRIIPVASLSSFKLTQLRPTKNNVRPVRWLEMIKTSTKKESEWDLSSLSPTPHYNMSILEDLILIEQHNIIKRVLEICPGARKAVVIAKVWLTQRGYRFGLDTLDGHGVSLFIAYLFQKRIVTAQMSSFTIFQCFLKYLGETNFSEEHLYFVDDPSIQKEDFDQFAAVLTFPVKDEKHRNHFFNVLWRWSASFVDEVSETARLSLDTLSDGSISNSFNQVFMSSLSFFKQYDLIFHIPVMSKSSFNSRFEEARNSCDDPFILGLGEKTLDSLHDYSAWQECSVRAREVILRALGDRALSVRTLSTPLQSKLNSDRYSQALCIGSAHYPQYTSEQISGTITSGCLEDMAYVSIGIMINTAEGTNRRVDRGPSATEEEEGAKFSEFWGNKARLRRFRDGTIVEAVVWGDDDQNVVPHADSLINEIVMYSVTRHLHYNLADESHQVLAVSNQLEYYLPVNNTSSSSLTRSVIKNSDSKTLFRKAVESLDTLRKMMTSKISDFPLIFESFSGAHSSLRYTSFIPPIEHPIATGTKQALNALSGKKVTRMLEPLTVVGSLSKSSRWPAELSALRSAKTALIIRLSKCIKNQFDLKSMVHREYLDIFFHGFIYRVHLYTDQEILLMSNPHVHLMQQVAPPRHTFDKYDNEEACQLYRRMVVNPLHHAAIRGLSSRFSAFGDTVRMMMCWRDNHVLSNHLCDETIELIVASVFTEQDHVANVDELPCSTIPQSPTVALLRALDRLSHFNWADSILLVDFLTYTDEDQGLENTKKNIQDVNALFSSVKAMGHAPAMCIGAQYDENGGFLVNYGLKIPDRSVVSIITGMAQGSSEKLIQWMSDPRSSSVSAVMLADNDIMKSCNVVLRFRSSIICGKNKGNGKIAKFDNSGASVMNSYVNGPSSARIEIFSNISSSEKSGDLLVCRSAPLPHPLQVEVAESLNAEFGHLALFFFNKLQGNDLGIRWKPNAFLPARFSLLQCRHHHVSSKHPSSGSGEGGVMILNAASVVSEIVNRTDGLVESVSFL